MNVSVRIDHNNCCNGGSIESDVSETRKSSEFRWCQCFASCLRSRQNKKHSKIVADERFVYVAQAFATQVPKKLGDSRRLKRAVSI